MSPPPETAPKQAALSVAAFNMQARPDALAAFARLSQDMDVIYLAEVPRRAAELIDFTALFPDHHITQRPYASNLNITDGSMTILLKGQEGQVSTLYVGQGDQAHNNRTILDIRLERQGQTIRVLATHALIPARPDYLSDRNQTLARLRSLYHQPPISPQLLWGI